MGESVTELRSHRRTNGRRAGDLPTVARERPRWLRRRAASLACLDGLAAVAATLSSQFLAFGFGHAELSVRGTEIPYAAGILAVVPAWLFVIATAGGYDVGPFGEPTKQTRRVISAGTHFLALMAVAYYIVHLEQLGRDFMIAIAPLATGYTLALRAAARGSTRLRRERGRATRSAIILGPSTSTRPLLEHIARHPEAGIVPVAALLPANDPTDPAEVGVPVAGTHDDLFGTLQETRADVLVVTGNLRKGELRDLSWKLEGTGIDVLVAPTVSETAAFLDVRPVAGLPLLWVDRPD